MLFDISSIKNLLQSVIIATIAGLLVSCLLSLRHLCTGQVQWLSASRCHWQCITLGCFILSVCVSLSVCVVCVSVCLSVCMFVCVCLYACLNVRFSDRLQIDVTDSVSHWVVTLSVCLSVCVYMYICLTLCLCLSGSVTVYKLTSLTVYHTGLFHCLSVCTYVCLSVFICFSVSVCQV